MEEVRRRPGRPVAEDQPESREEAVSTERRRRKGTQGQYNLYVPPEMYAQGAPLDPAKWVARWVNDEKNRLQQLTQEDDWELVGRAGLSRVDAEDVFKYPIGRHDDGKTRFAFLCRKLKRYAADDRAEQSARVAEIQRDALRGRPLNAPPVEEGYTPRDA